jgi:hypothetical protein
MKTHTDATPDAASQGPMGPPAICSSCGRIFAATHIFDIGEHINAGFFGVRVNCPYCGGVADIPDGFYSFRQLVEEITEEAPRDEQRLARQTVEALRAAKASGAEAADAIEKIGSRWGRLADFLRPRSGTDIAVYLAALVPILDEVLKRV